MDVLSEVLRVVRLSGAIHFCAEFTHPWALLSSPPERLAARLAPGSEVVIPFHIATEGTSWLSMGKAPPILIEAGDLIVFVNAPQHSHASELGLTPVPVADVFRPSEAITTMRYGGGGKVFRIICGYLHSDQRFGPLLDAMPALFRVRMRDSVLQLDAFTNSEKHAEPVSLDQGARWWSAAIDHLVTETAKPGPGNRAVLARLSELLFMEILRWQLTYFSEGHRGWLAGLNDPHVGRALSLLHAAPAQPWTVEDLAKGAGVSRATLAKRFLELVGETPMQYLAGWRMQLARRELRDSTLGLAEISARVGYASEAAFNRAFRRHVGVPPASWRQANAASIASRPANQEAARISTTSDQRH